MTDISMCSGNKCPIKKSCYRYTAKADSEWQCYIEPQWKEEDVSCETYWPVELSEKKWGY